MPAEGRAAGGRSRELSRACRDVLAHAAEAVRPGGPATDPAVRAAAASLLAAGAAHPGLAEIEALARYVTTRPVAGADA